MSPDNGRILVWDVAVRTLHWTLAALVVFNLLRDEGDKLHRVAGYVAAAVVVLRLIWATASTGYSSMTQLRPSISATRRYLYMLWRRQAPHYVGHNPLGLWMAWTLWLLVLLLGITGWMSRLDTFWGDERIHAIHALLADALLACAVVHILGVAAMSWRWRENLLAAMLTGRKRPPSE